VLLTVGHGTLDRTALAELLVTAGVETLVDVRRFPGSRVNPDVRREALEQWVPAAGIAYRWEERLGGRRSLPRGQEPADPWWTVAAFRAYAAHSRTEPFASALSQVLHEAHAHRVAVMCSESTWWRCHRRLIADYLTAVRGLAVAHLLPGPSVRPHSLSQGGRRAAHGLVYDAPPLH
jgi:uncharacterized protein (DUF488 family)